MNLVQIFICEEETTPLSDWHRAIITKTKARFSSHKYTLFDNQQIIRFLRENYPNIVLEAYNSIKPFAYKADLARYCILHKIGGWYIDLGVLWMVDVSDRLGPDLIAFKDRQEICGSAWAIHNGAFYARAGHPALAIAIEIVIHNFKNRYYGRSSLCPTGPNVLGSAIARLGSKHKNMIGVFRDLTPEFPHKNTAFILPNGQIAALYKPGFAGDPGRMDKIQGKGTNDYNRFYLERNVYGEHGS